MSHEISNIVLRFFEAVDAKSWAGARELMSDSFYLDYSSFGRGPAVDLPADDVVAGWEKVHPGFDHAHHQLGALNIDEGKDEATVRCDVTATHFIAGAAGSEIWTVYGSYILGLHQIDGAWKLSAQSFLFKFQKGNLNLRNLAQERVAHRNKLI